MQWKLIYIIEVTALGITRRYERKTSRGANNLEARMIAQWGRHNVAAWTLRREIWG